MFFPKSASGLVLISLLCFVFSRSVLAENNFENLYTDIYQNASGYEDFYLKIYETEKKHSQEAVLNRVSAQVNLDNQDIEQALEGNFTENFLKQCTAMFGSETLDTLYRCQGIIKENFQYEQHLADLEGKLLNEALSSEVWSDGDLSNSFFDVMVDFTILEIILFGENTYVYPFDGADQRDNQSSLRRGESEENAIVDITIETTVEPEFSSEFQTCLDPDEIKFSQVVWQKTSSSDFSQPQSSYQGGNFADFNSESDCEGIKLFKGLLCVDPWPCESFFCIRVSAIPQVANGNRKEATTVQELVTTAIEQLTYLKGHSLTVHKNSNERFIVSVGKFLSRPLSLDVVTQGIPVKFKPQKSAFDNENNQSQLERFRTKLSEETGWFFQDNGDLLWEENSRALQMQIEGGLSTEAWSKINQNQADFQTKKEIVQNNWIKSERVKQTQSRWEELKVQFNMIANYFKSIEEVFVKMDLEGIKILEDTSQTCNSK